LGFYNKPKFLVSVIFVFVFVLYVVDNVNVAPANVSKKSSQKIQDYNFDVSSRQIIFWRKRTRRARVDPNSKQIQQLYD
jgi:hypothetical protein